MKRNASIELYRCLCMAGVVLLHALTQGGYADGHRGLDNLMVPSVVGFVFISGYFGIGCRLKSVLKLLGIGLSSYIVLVVLSGGNFGSSFAIRGYWWFLWMYLVLMTLAPVVNIVIEENLVSEGVIYKVLPFLFVVYVWSYAATTVPVLKTVIPSVIGFSPFGVLTFLATYIAARISKLYEKKLHTKWLFLAVIASGVFIWIGFYHYSSPFALIFAGSTFYLCKRLPLPHSFAKIITSISPSMFSVYLLHTNELGFQCLRKAEDHLMSAGWNYYVMAVIVAIGIFVGCVTLDIPRRALLYYLEKKSCRN